MIAWLKKYLFKRVEHAKMLRDLDDCLEAVHSGACGPPPQIVQKKAQRETYLLNDTHKCTVYGEDYLGLKVAMTEAEINATRAHKERESKRLSRSLDVGAGRIAPTEMTAEDKQIQEKVKRRLVDVHFAPMPVDVEENTKAVLERLPSRGRCCFPVKKEAS